MFSPLKSETFSTLVANPSRLEAHMPQNFDGLIAIEVKRRRNHRGSDLRGLRSFGSDYPMAKLYCFYGGDMVEYYGDIIAMPIEEGLKKLPEILKSDQA